MCRDDIVVLLVVAYVTVEVQSVNDVVTNVTVEVQSVNGVVAYVPVEVQSVNGAGIEVGYGRVTKCER